jgi:hypothetical protein
VAGSDRARREKGGGGGECGHFSFIFNARSSLPTRLVLPTVSFNSPPIIFHLSSVPPRQPLRGDGVFPSFSASRRRRKYSLDFNAPTFSSHRVPKSFIRHHQPYSTAVPRTRCQHCQYTRTFHKATLTTPSRRSQHVKPTDAKFQRTKPSDGVLMT